jgi:hypothetical protein
MIPAPQSLSLLSSQAVGLMANLRVFDLLRTALMYTSSQRPINHALVYTVNISVNIGCQTVVVQRAPPSLLHTCSRHKHAFIGQTCIHVMTCTT